MSEDNITLGEACLELRPIGEASFGLFDGDTVIEHLVFEVDIALASGLKRMTIVADPRNAHIFKPCFDLVISFGGVIFRRRDDQIRIFWSDDEVPYLFRENAR